MSQLMHRSFGGGNQTQHWRTDRLHRRTLQGRQLRVRKKFTPGGWIVIARGDVNHRLSLVRGMSANMPATDDQSVCHKVHRYDIGYCFQINYVKNMVLQICVESLQVVVKTFLLSIDRQIPRFKTKNIATAPFMLSHQPINKPY